MLDYVKKLLVQFSALSAPKYIAEFNSAWIEP